MNSKLFFVILLVFAGAVVFGLTAKPKQGLSTTASPNTQTGTQLSGLSPQTKTMGLVEVEVTPASVTLGKDIVFDVVMNNHSVDLGYDYIRIATLTDDQGNTYKPSEWKRATGGHHIKGELIFPPFSKQPKELTVTFDGVDNKSEIFIWQL
ncbi:hypothetical protein KKF92_01850 [Patescibacteria group bacterium]|nr:hypothetical protein [Patescibacteria group bacterium]